MPMEGILMRTELTQLINKFRAISVLRCGLLLVFCALLGFVLLGLNRRMPKVPVQSVTRITQRGNFPMAPQTEAGYLTDDDKQKNLPAIVNEFAGSRAALGNGIGAAVPASPTPLIAHSAELAIATKEFARSRTSLEEILERHRGYAARLRMAGRRTGSVLSATLRVPSTELASTVSELKSLGEVEQEEQAADEITQQRADLEARLSNAQGTLRRLQELLNKQTYPDGNVRELQRQIVAASAEVNRLEAERQASEHRVVFANVQFSLREEVASPQESLSAQLHGAAAGGFNEAAASLAAILLFLIGRGPLVLLWMAILFIPARFMFRRWSISASPATTPVAQS
jgi:hypothetical protein